MRSAVVRLLRIGPFWWIAALVTGVLVCSFVPGLPANGYGWILLIAIPPLFFFRHPQRRKRLALYVLGVGLHVLAYPDPDLGFLGWILLWPYLLARSCDDGASWWRSAFLFGFLRAYAGYYWLGNVHFLGWIAISVLSGLVFAFVFELTVRRVTLLPFGLRVATGWLLFEWVSTWLFGGGFPWLFLSHTQYRYLPVIQVAAIVGALGLSFLLAFIQTAAFQALRGRRLAVETGVAAVLFLGVIVYGLVTGVSRETPDRPGVLMIQSNVPHAVKEGKLMPASEMWGSHMRQTSEGLRNHPEAKLVVWPETMHPIPYVEDNATRYGFNRYLQSGARQFERPVIYGVNSYADLEGVKRLRGYNSAVLVDTGGTVRGVYRKQRLVPLGEEFLPRRYFPADWCDSWFDWLNTNAGLPRSCDLEPGQGFATFDAGEGLRCAMLICSEIFYPEVVRDAVRHDDPDLVLHLVNNGWFGPDFEQRQFVALWVFRAVETRTPVFSCANCGITAAVAPSGEILGRVDKVMEKGVLYAEVPLRWEPSLYLRWGDWVTAAILAAAVVVAVWRGAAARNG